MVKESCLVPGSYLVHILMIDYEVSQEYGNCDAPNSHVAKPSRYECSHLIAAANIDATVHFLLILNQKIHVIFPYSRNLLFRASQSVNISAISKVFSLASMRHECFLTKLRNDKVAVVAVLVISIQLVHYHLGGNFIRNC